MLHGLGGCAVVVLNNVQQWQHVPVAMDTKMSYQAMILMTDRCSQRVCLCMWAKVWEGGCA